MIAALCLEFCGRYFGIEGVDQWDGVMMAKALAIVQIVAISTWIIVVILALWKLVQGIIAGRASSAPRYREGDGKETR